MGEMNMSLRRIYHKKYKTIIEAINKLKETKM